METPASFQCDHYDANGMIDHSYKSIVVLQKKQHFVFDVYVHSIEWDIARIIWIGFYKNSENDKCFIHQLPKELLKCILGLLGKTTGLKNANRAPYIKI